ncbi:MAG: tetratricopeptide repeat protein [Bacteroidetes bacterium]|nr:tetratricopeptide repeat protein [Bacteroidota bacterium]
MNKQASKSQTKAAFWENLSFDSFKLQALILIFIGFFIYGNSFKNEYALDDGIVIIKNEYVQQGLRGIPKILKTDSYDSFYKQMNAKQQLSGGRYRPLSVVTFAIEEQIFGNGDKESPSETVTMVRHMLNVAFYILSVIVLLQFLRTYIFKENTVIPFLTCLIFLIHPLHTEVVANIKSRDEILSFLFIILTFMKALQYNESKQTKYLVWSLVFYFLALLSKEYAITLLVLLPLLFYVLLKDTFIGSIKKTIPFIFVAVVYLLIRFSIVGVGSTQENTDVLNNPYMFASPTEKLATKIEVLNHYLKLMFYPYPLSSDYSYSTIPYTSFTDPKVWFSIGLTLLLIVLTLYFFKKRNILSFALAFYLLHLFMISNLVMDIGATMGERLVYHSSFGFAFVIAVLFDLLTKKMNSKSKQTALIVFGLLITLPSASIVMERNDAWTNDKKLFTTDAWTVPNSALVNGNAGKAYVDLSEMDANKSMEKELLGKALLHLHRSVKIHDKYVNGYLNLGVVYFKLNNYVKAEEYWRIAQKIYPNNPFLKRNFGVLATTYFNDAMKIGSKDVSKAIKGLEKACELDPGNVEYWYNLGGASFTIKDYEKAKQAWTRTLQLKPDHLQAQQGMSAIPKE